jgi:hypothetical protein
MYTKNLSYLNQFLGYNVEVSNQNTESTYHYNNFQWDAELYNQLILMDGDEADCKTYIPLENIKEIKNLTEDLYTTVVTIKTIHYTYDICCIEDKPIIPICDKCKKEFGEFDAIWSVNQLASFGSTRDGDNISVKVCDNCFEKMFELIIPETKGGEWYE